MARDDGGPGGRYWQVVVVVEVEEIVLSRKKEYTS